MACSEPVADGIPQQNSHRLNGGYIVVVNRSHCVHVRDFKGNGAMVEKRSTTMNTRFFRHGELTNANKHGDVTIKKVKFTMCRQ